MIFKKHLYFNILAVILIGCSSTNCTKKSDSALEEKPKTEATSVALTGFNELFSLSHLFFVVSSDYSQYSWVMESVPHNMPDMPASKASDLLNTFVVNGRHADVFRDILSLKTIEPIEGTFPFDSEIFTVLQMYEKRNVELILAFSNPYPNWVAAKVQSLGGSKTTEMEIVAGIISNLLSRQQKIYGLDPTWMAAKLKIEPYNEFNAEVSGNAADAATLDNAVNTKLKTLGIPCKEVLASSIISGTQNQYLSWWTSYYKAGGKGTPNIHLYPMQNEGINMSTIIARWESVVATLQDSVKLPKHNRVVIGEIGFPRAGLGIAGTETVHDSFIETIYKSKRIQSADRVMFWRIFSDWLSIDCADGTCDALTAKETTFGYLNYRSNTPESQMTTRFFLSGFWWTH